MAFDKTNLAPGQTARSSDVLQLVNALDGTANYGQPITLNKLNSNSAYALDVQNLGTGGGFRVKSTGGATLLDVTDSGVSYTLAAITVPSSAGAAPTGEGVMEWDSDDDLLKVGTGAATKVLVDTTATQTLTNKTLTAPTLTTVTVSSGGMVVTGDSSAIRQVTSTQPILQFQPVDDLNPNNVAFGVTNAAVGAYTFSVNKNGGTIIAAGGLTVSAGGLTVTAGGATITGGFSVANGTNVGLGATSYGSGTGVICIANTAAAPTGNPTASGLLYVEGGALKYRGSSGSTTTLAVA